MYHVSAQGVVEREINVHYYYYIIIIVVVIHYLPTSTLTFRLSISRSELRQM